ncbi:hypothetical protein Q4E93_27895 [Flavitalea sp. BT771]|uniref:hypothetical protein n=1 Tax=Flavitalea sp. BT771 TaxID=3063329 RepID=UPI0026E2A031|nr:hypothetical protein [Flavitalea sp. BT771]MDO6434466.1 hypothetical protein [Flavitalea sp. BT771]MDV6223366.1 hypothetical protein [Flavitalea sp. BT771]
MDALCHPVGGNVNVRVNFQGVPLRSGFPLQVLTLLAAGFPLQSLTLVSATC